ncbi:hypothetical protein ANN_16217 [Periplaneta americana]|uniref:Ig-like domain-containing protein n=1 Tax=Periplaneta americana TaxID=6978 RepID=A0ABQ8SIE2_PERAM|nr:hypothetical protein ANN_16217 [Periplaneta americana]
MPVIIRLRSFYHPDCCQKNLKVRIYKTVILPAVLYGCETWTLTLREEQRLRVFENKVFRKIFGAKRGEFTGEWRKLHNTELHALYSSPDIIRNIKSRRLRWAGHVARMGESRNAYRVLIGRPEGKKPLERPRRRWEDNIKMDLREVGYDDRDWINLSQDRDQWRAYIISYDSPRGGVSVITEKGETTTSFLLIQKARPSDSGRYQCNPSNAQSKSITVHVLNGIGKQYVYEIFTHYYKLKTAYFWTINTSHSARLDLAVATKESTCIPPRTDAKKTLGPSTKLVGGRQIHVISSIPNSFSFP